MSPKPSFEQTPVPEQLLKGKIAALRGGGMRTKVVIPPDLQDQTREAARAALSDLEEVKPSTLEELYKAIDNGKPSKEIGVVAAGVRNMLYFGVYFPIANALAQEQALAQQKVEKFGAFIKRYLESLEQGQYNSYRTYGIRGDDRMRVQIVAEELSLKEYITEGKRLPAKDEIIVYDTKAEEYLLVSKSSLVRLS